VGEEDGAGEREPGNILNMFGREDTKRRSVAFGEGRETAKM
jgi:hypothetical protein